MKAGDLRPGGAGVLREMRGSLLSFTRWRRLLVALALILALTVAGTLGYHFIEGWPLLDSLYMTIITLATVGYGETHPLNEIGRVFTIGLIVTAVGAMGYAISSLATFIIEGEFNSILQGQRMSNRIAKLENHIILCGGGATGKYVAEELAKTHTPYVLVEQDTEHLQRVLETAGDIPYLQGDATRDETLLSVGIERARGLIAVLGEDKDNVFVVLSARSLNPKLRIVSRLIEEENAEKLRKAGADEIVSANAIGGLRMASVMIRPSVVSFLDQMMRVPDQTLRVDEIHTGDAPGLVGQTLIEADLKRRAGVLIVAVKSEDGQYHFNPDAHTVLNRGDVLIVIGTPEQLARIRQ
jgi:voltage-gated potassium channel